jgi:hypothetical protein
MSLSARASSGDPQIKTDDPWFPGELSCSTFARLFQTQAELYQRVTGRKVENDEDRRSALMRKEPCCGGGGHGTIF